MFIRAHVARCEESEEHLCRVSIAVKHFSNTIMKYKFQELV
jgi:hypothetical protein